ncbi:MAG: neutral zinc metallopeptidase [Burkholderiales bacterium]|nr:neutral zinc metallopeptidase [Burkholderiales bacterium]
MRWQGRETSNNVEDRRGQSGFGGGMNLPKGKMGLAVLAVVLVAGYFGIDLTPVLEFGSDPATYSNQTYKPTAEEQQLANFSSVALKSTEDTWRKLFKNSGKNYVPPKMVLYSGSTQTACGYGQAAMGPFYCPSDNKLYVDLSFYKDMQRNLGGGGDFALGYVLAHEVGHHVQNLLGIADQVRQEQSRVSQKQANQLSVMLELQADCLAGVWGHDMNKQGILEQGDLEKALRTAAAIGDDRLQKQSTGRVVPDSFTHGTSEQRYKWFKVGFDSGNPEMCNTFKSGLR